jgi:hypothetical protein
VIKVALREAFSEVKENKLSNQYPSVRSQPSSSREVLELDLLRGIAAIFMVVNHAGYRLLEENLQHSGPMAALLFISSFAPVIFFFVTGFGVGVSREARGAAPQMVAVLQKAGLLFIADQFLYWRHGVAFGLDFLGFIALAAVLCTWVATRPNRFAIACTAFAVIFLVRFVFGPRLNALDLGPWMRFLIGVGDVAHVSYPFSPWMALPALGLAVGLRYPQRAATLDIKNVWNWVSLVVAGLFLALSAGAYLIGASFFRWGTMGLGFFVMSFAMVAVIGWFSIQFSAVWPRVSDAIGIRGVASFAVVPVHYVGIDVAAVAVGRHLSQGEFLVCAAVLITLSYGLSKFIAAAVQRVVKASQPAIAIGMLCIVLICALVLLFSTDTSTNLRMLMMVFGQLAICGLFVFIPVRRA